MIVSSSSVMPIVSLLSSVVVVSLFSSLVLLVVHNKKGDGRLLLVDTAAAGIDGVDEYCSCCLVSAMLLGIATGSRRRKATAHGVDETRRRRRSSSR